MFKIILVDTFNLFIRCFTTSKELNENGLHIGAITSSIMSLYSWIKRFNPDVVFLCYEGKQSGLRRRRSFHDYKDGRRNPHTISQIEYSQNNAFWNELKIFFALIEQMPFCNISVDYLEADDIIYYLNNRFKNDEKIIVSTDEDYYQLISKNTSVYSPTKTQVIEGEKVKGKFITEEVLLKEYNIIPQNWVIRKTLLGDRSDNIQKEKLTKGIGNKTIQKLFPELAEKEFTINEFIELAKIKQNDNKKLNGLTDEKTIYSLTEKYKLMNLTNSNFSVSSIDKIESLLKSWQPEYDHFNLNLLLQKNMVSLKIQFSSLSSILRGLFYASRKFKEYV